MASPNPLSKLASILKHALDNGNVKAAIAAVLAESMGAKKSVQQLTDFYLIVDEAHKSALDLEKITGQSDALEAIEDLRHLLFKFHTWSTPWEGLAIQIRNGRHATILSAMGTVYDLAFSQKTLEKEFLSLMLNNFSAIEQSIIDESISNKLKAVILRHIEEIRSAIKNYLIYGNRGVTSALSKSVGEMISDPSIRQEANKNKVVKKYFALAVISSRLVFEMIGAAADIDSFLLPRLEEAFNQHESTPLLDSSLEDIGSIIDKHMMSFNQKLLPPAPEKNSE